MTQRMLRYQLSIAGPHRLEVPGVILQVAARTVGVPHDEASWIVEFWALTRDTDRPRFRTFQVFGTGHEVPAEAMWVGSAERTAQGLVWHLFELSEGADRG